MLRLCQIGPFVFQLSLPQSLPAPENLSRFDVSGVSPAYSYELRLTPEFSLPRYPVLLRRPDLTVLQTPAGEARVLGIGNHPVPMGCYQELEPCRARVDLSPAWMPYYSADTVFTSLLALERRMIALEQLVLHCAYINYQGEAILFSAPSETGKTTQANLWEQYRGARTVNGDRALLGRIDGRWTAQGWPVCGSSGVCRNQSLPIRAIVMLSQAPENRARRLSPLSAVQLIFGQITINRWNPAFTQTATDLVLALCREVPVYHLGCTISEEAVEVLEGTMDK